MSLVTQQLYYFVVIPQVKLLFFSHYYSIDCASSSVPFVVLQTCSVWYQQHHYGKKCMVYHFFIWISTGNPHFVWISIPIHMVIHMILMVIHISIFIWFSTQKYGLPYGFPYQSIWKSIYFNGNSHT